MPRQIQKEHYAAYDAMLAAKNQEMNLQGIAGINYSSNNGNMSKLWNSSGEVPFLVNCHTENPHDVTIPRFIYPHVSGNLQAIFGQGVSLGVEMGIIIDRENNDWKPTFFTVGSIDNGGFDLPGGSIGVSFSDDFSNINEAFEGLKGGGYSTNISLLNYSRSEDGKWQGQSFNIAPWDIFTASVSYTQTEDFLTDLKKVSGGSKKRNFERKN